MGRRTRIVATLGPACNDADALGDLLDAGVDMVRLNLSHGTRQTHEEVVSRVRRAAEERKLEVPVLVDLMGPRYRLGELPSGGIQLELGNDLTLGIGPNADLPMNASDLLEHLHPGERILVGDGLAELEVKRSGRHEVIARVTVPGTATTRKMLHFPNSDLPFRLTAKDVEDLEWVLSQGLADVLVVSFVGAPEHVDAVRAYLEVAGLSFPSLFAKLERAAAVRNLEGILAVSDGVFVSTASLFVELPVHEAAVHLKRIVDAGHVRGKQVFLATQMLESMLDQPRPRSTEAFGVANMVFSRADALVLSVETAAGGFPAESVGVMDQLIREAEGYLGSRRSEDPSSSPTEAGRERIVRSIEFPPEHRQSGVSILSYFARIVERKYGDEEIGVTIEQHGNKVTLVVETPEGRREAVEQTLEQYGRVVLDEVPADQLLDKELEILELRQELRLAEVRIQNLQEIGALREGALGQLYELLELSIRKSGSETTILNQPQAIAGVELSMNEHLHDLRSDLSELERRLPSGSEARKEAEEVARALEAVPEGADRDFARQSGALGPVRRFLERLGDEKSPLSKTVRGFRKGVEIGRRMARTYNAIAVWCGLPSVPEPFLGKTERSQDAPKRR